MNDRRSARPITLSIAAVERDTGLSKDTLRVWERRYGFPQPARDDFGERVYPIEQVEKLRTIKRLLNGGHRPGRIVAMPIDDLQRLADSCNPAPPRSAPDAAAPDLRDYIELIRSHDVDSLRRALSQSLLRIGLGRFVVEVIAPLNLLVGDSWMRGHLEIFEEHLYTESIHVVLRSAIASVPSADVGDRPRVLLTTFPNEPHGIGLLMAETLFVLEGARCVSLGTQTPIWDIALAATALRADIVALSFTSVLTPTLVHEGLAELRDKLPRSVELWAGGAAPVLHRRPVADVLALDALEAVGPEVRRWRAERG
ncbi:MerR family transcriptional regulator [Rivibacter subsaxonicus]|uniref:DNA-binding transcriptional MerR regulator n=1 Tax=Rivibacter subsaxonicus TaxID=457575 RepID=A0A4Q7VVW4_9BURK|nr:MerR family transcriptional regulator [Rivibacter subsaxonicus]RZU00645.1 DNA-binding transcriptional MerR regulator [Rivibacter subsaxonicus]